MTMHTRLTAWWLAQAWRVEELSRGALDAWQGGRPVGAALSARGLLETAAVLHHDADRLEAAWHRVKAAGPPRVGADAIGGELFHVVNVLELGGVFSDELADLKEALDPFKRRSVVTDVGKLARQLGPDVRELYEWLSNVAHPSFGTMLAYSSPMHVHPTGTHSVRVVAGDPGCADLVALRSTRQLRMDSVGGMTARAVALGCRHAALTLERALRTVDDLGSPAVRQRWRRGRTGVRWSPLPAMRAAPAEPPSRRRFAAMNGDCRPRGWAADSGHPQGSSRLGRALAGRRRSSLSGANPTRLRGVGYGRRRKVPTTCRSSRTGWSLPCSRAIASRHEEHCRLRARTAARRAMPHSESSSDSWCSSGSSVGRWFLRRR